MTIPIRSMAELLAALRTRRDELQLTHETLDAIAGWAGGYSSKLFAPDPIKNLGWQSLGLALGALGIAIVVVEDQEQGARVRKRWIRRERPARTAASACRLSTAELQAKLELSERMKMLGKLGGKASAKRRMKTMGKRARQRAASHAARIRWSKREASA
jgi:hypothetical protein